jgi:acyl-CoA synthetase (AMP-forming)/AMP-acid ligase II
MSLWKVFERSVRLYENKTALIFGEERISYKQLYEKSCHIADHLYKIAGGKEQQKVFILSKNSIDMVALMLACMRRNLIACPVNWRLSARELAVILKNHNYVIRICDEENRGLLEAACSFIPEETFVKADLRDLTDDKKAVPAVPAADPDGEDIVIQLFYQRKYGNTESDRPHQCRYDRLHV